MHAVSTGICTVAFKHCWSKASVKIQAQTKRGIVGNCSTVFPELNLHSKTMHVGTRNN